ncbi:regulator [Streptomyces sp. NPDC001530]|uniref:regulator n=1 Tax=Streptomyces sp. NPDC001530 TaxID=3364582 RepID=UPI0036BF3D16
MVRALIGLNMARQELGAVLAPEVELLHDAVRDTEEALAGVREVTDALCPGALRAGGLPAALAALARRHPGRLTVSGTLRGRLPLLVETHAYLLVAEAVERALEHGGAARVQVTADLGPSLLLAVVDDGAPPVTAADLAALSALTERAASLAGTLTVRHTPGTGTTLTATVPLGPTDGP